MTKLKQHPYLVILFFVFLGIGISFLTTSSTVIVDIIFKIIGISLILNGFFKSMYYYQHNQRFGVIESVIDILVGILIIFQQNLFISIFFGVVYIVLPIIRITASEAKRRQLYLEIPRLIIGVLIFFSVDAFYLIVNYILGVAFLIFAVLIVVYIFKMGPDSDEFAFSEYQSSRKDVIDVEYEEKEVYEEEQ